jgi:hypothetical protein
MVRTKRSDTDLLDESDKARDVVPGVGGGVYIDLGFAVQQSVLVLLYGDLLW